MTAEPMADPSLEITQGEDGERTTAHLIYVQEPSSWRIASGTKDEVLAQLGDLRRKIMRAEAALLDRNGDWDPIGNKALIVLPGDGRGIKAYVGTYADDSLIEEVLSQRRASTTGGHLVKTWRATLVDVEPIDVLPAKIQNRT